MSSRHVVVLAVALAASAVASHTALAGHVGSDGKPSTSDVTSNAAGPTCSSLVYCTRFTIDVGGNGRGTVVSDPPGIDCTVTAGIESGDCTETFTWPRSVPGFFVYLRATAAEGSRVCKVLCSPTAVTPVQLLPSRSDVTYSAVFAVERLAISVSRSGPGTGRVVSAPAGISCGAACSAEFDYGTRVALTADPEAGAVFRAWTGACAGRGPVCTVEVTEATSTNAVFELASAGPPPPAPSPPPPPSPSPPPPTTAAPDRSVEADVGAAAAGRTPLGARVVRIELTADEPLTATLQLRRGGTTRASRRYLRIGRGERLLTILVPRTLPAGPATLRLQLADLAGNSKGARRQITIGGRA